MGYALLLIAVAGARPATAQNGRPAAAGENASAPSLPSLPSNRLGETAQTPVGPIGQRQTREAASRTARIAPMTRLDSRLPNRVEARVRNRIDRFYDPQANAASPFVVAGNRVRRPLRR